MLPCRRRPAGGRAAGIEKILELNEEFGHTGLLPTCWCSGNVCENDKRNRKFYEKDQKRKIYDVGNTGTLYKNMSDMNIYLKKESLGIKYCTRLVFYYANLASEE